MNRLVALVDGSVYAGSVCDHAAWIARSTGASVELHHVLGRRETATIPTDLSGTIALGARADLIEELRALDERRAKLAQQRGQAILDDARARVMAAGGFPVTAWMHYGDIVETVTECEAGADMLVIGKRGEAADFARLHLGSNLERIVRSCHRPVFVASRTFRPVERVLIAFDGGSSSMKAVEHVAGSPLFAGLRLRLLTAGAETAEGRERLEAARAALARAGRDADAGIVDGQPEAVIAREVEAAAVDLLVMGAYGHSRIRSLIIGSTTTAMVRSCRIPVVLFR